MSQHDEMNPLHKRLKELQDQEELESSGISPQATPPDRKRSRIVTSPLLGVQGDPIGRPLPLEKCPTGSNKPLSPGKQMPRTALYDRPVQSPLRLILPIEKLSLGHTNRSTSNFPKGCMSPSLLLDAVGMESDDGSDDGSDDASHDASYDSIESFSSDEPYNNGSSNWPALKGSSFGSSKGTSKGSHKQALTFVDSEDSHDADDDGLTSGKGRGASGKSLVSGKRVRVSGSRRGGASGKATYQTLAAGNPPTATGKPQTNPSGKPKKTGKPKPNKRKTWEDEATDEWLLDGKSKETIRKYRSHIDDLYQFLMEHCDIQPNEWYTQVTYTNLLAWRKYIIATASKSTKQPRVAAVKSLFKTLVQNRRIKENPAQHLKVPSKPPPSTVVRYLTTKEVATTLAATNTQKDRGLIAGCYYGMLRLKEVRTLKYESCTFVEENGTELLQLHVIGKGQDEKERDVLVGKKGTTMLKPVVLATKEGQYLFPGNDGPLSSRQTGRRIKNVFKRAGLPRSSAHWLRHAGASHAHDNGATLVHLRDILGHSDVKVTSRYLHSDPGTAAARALDRDGDEEEEEEEDSVPKTTPKETSQQLKMEIIQLYKDKLITKEDMMEMMKS